MKIENKNENLIPIIHRLVTNNKGENYWFNACAGYVMECLGEKDYDYSFFAGITGDNFTQHYKFGFYGDGVSAYPEFYGEGEFFRNIFAICGYEADYVFVRDMAENREKYLNEIVRYIDMGIPVISLGSDVRPTGVYVGYEEGGEVLLYMSGENDEPKRISADIAMKKNGSRSGDFTLTEEKNPDNDACIFVREKKESVPLADIYRKTIFKLPELLTVNNEKFCFGAAAFRKWADDIDSGIFDEMEIEKFDGWGMYQNFVCVLATNGSCCFNFLNKALELNPDMNFLREISDLYRKTGAMWGELEEIGGGFNISLETLQNKEKRAKITEKLRDFAYVFDDIVNVLKKGKMSCKN